MADGAESKRRANELVKTFDIDGTRFPTPQLAYAEAERAIAEAGTGGAPILQIKLRHLQFLPPSIADLDRLKVLSLERTGVQDLPPLQGLGGLTMLSLDDSRVSDLTPLAGLVALNELSLNRTGVSDLRPLAGLGRLTALRLNQTWVRDLTPLQGLTGLTRLWLDQTGVSDLTPLQGLLGLTALYLNQTAISDLTPLAGLTGLIRLRLSQTRVSDLTPLAGLTDLRQLSLDQTEVGDLTPLRKLTALADAVQSASDELLSLYGLSYAGTPVAKGEPFSELVALNQPSRTVETLNILRLVSGLPPYYPLGDERAKDDRSAHGGSSSESSVSDDTESIPTPREIAEVTAQVGRALRVSGSPDQPIEFAATGEPDERLSDTPRQRTRWTLLREGVGDLVKLARPHNSLSGLVARLESLSADLPVVLADADPDIVHRRLNVVRRAIEANERVRGADDSLTPLWPEGVTAEAIALQDAINVFSEGDTVLRRLDAKARERALDAKARKTDAVLEQLTDAIAAADPDLVSASVRDEAKELASVGGGSMADARALAAQAELAPNVVKEVIRIAVESVQRMEAASQEIKDRVADHAAATAAFDAKAEARHKKDHAPGSIMRKMFWGAVGSGVVGATGIVATAWIQTHEVLVREMIDAFLNKSETLHRLVDLILTTKLPF